MRGFLRAIQCLNIVAQPNDDLEVVGKDGAFPIFIQLGDISTSYLRLIFSPAFNLETRLGNGCCEPMRNDQNSVGQTGCIVRCVRNPAALSFTTPISYCSLVDSSRYTI